MESKRDKKESFKTVGEKRLKRTLKELNLLKNLSQTKNYEYNRKQVDHIIGNIKNNLEDLESLFEQGLRHLEKKNKISAKSEFPD